MRTIPADIASKLALTKQTKANSADISASLWIGRPTTALINDTFLERQTVLSTPATDVSIAVCHPRKGSSNTRIHIGYISNGIAHVATALDKTRMSSHVWVDTGFSAAADSISVAYDGTMPKNSNGQVEFITETQPWVFWTYNGTLKARKMGTDDVITLAENNCTDVSAIRAMWSEVGGFDFGLCVFFILSGTIYYRQLIDGEWKDAEVVSFGPAGVTWSEVAAFRTWDYRVGVQAKTSTGELYELFTQFMGVGKQNVEHLDVKELRASGTLSQVYYTDQLVADNLTVSSILSSGYMTYALSSKPISILNIQDETNNFGYYIRVVFDYPLSNVYGNASSFSITADGISKLIGQEITVTDETTILVKFLDFNNAVGDITVRYTPGSINSPATQLLEFSKSFTPTGLVPLIIPAPVVESITNI